MSNKKTAVEWLENELSKLYYDTQFKTFEEFHNKEVILWEQAKAMDKEQEFETKAYWFGRGILASKENRVDELKPKK